MTTSRGRGRGSVVLAVGLVLAAAGSAALTRPAGRTSAVRSASASGQLVTRTQLGCPDHSSGRRVDTSVRLGLVPGPGLGSGGRVRSGAGVELTRGRLVTVPSAGGPAVRAGGAAAAGLFGFRADRRPGRTLAVAPCVAPRARWWFTGAGAVLDHSSTLLLANLDPGTAVVDLRVLGPDGDVNTVATTGIVLAPGSRKRFDLADLAPETDDLAVEVRAERGRVAAAVTDALRTAPDAAWREDYLPGTARPGRALVLAGLPRTAQRRTLLVANPSELEAVVDVAVSGRSGSFTPTGSTQTSVAPGAVATVDLTRLLGGDEPAAVRLRSSQAVLAVVRSLQDDDETYAAPAAALSGPAAAPLVAGARATVQLTAGTVAARARVVAYDARGGRLGATTMSMGPAATSAWSPKAGAGYVVVSPTTGRSGRGSGTVQGAVSYRGGGLAAVPLVDLPLRELRPGVEPGLR